MQRTTSTKWPSALRGGRGLLVKALVPTELAMVPINQVNDPIARITLPILSRVYHDKVTYQRYVERAQFVGCYILAPLFAAAAALAVPMVALLLGPGWEGVGPIFTVLAIGGIFRGLTLVTYWVFLSSDQTGPQLRMYAVTRPIMIGLILAGVPFGPLGVAVGHSIAFALFWVVSLAYASSRAGLAAKRLFGQAFRSLLLVAIPTGLLAWAGSQPMTAPVGQVLLGGGCGMAYLTALLLIVPQERAELRRALRLLRRTNADGATRSPSIQTD